MSGKLAGKQPPQVLIDVGGVAYELDVPMSTFYGLPATGEVVTLFTHLSVKEDSHTLFGFATLEERSAFRQLIRISGVGARTALSVLSGLSVADLAQTVALQESAPLTRIPGIGKKTAERIVLELKDRVASLGLSPEAQAPATSPEDQLKGDVLSALQNLGYHRPLADKAVEAALAEAAADAPASFERVFKRALRALMRP